MFQSRVVLSLVAAFMFTIIPGEAVGATTTSVGLLAIARQSLVDEYSVLEGRGEAALTATTDEFGAMRSAADRLGAARQRRVFDAANGLTFVAVDVQLETAALSTSPATATLWARESTTLHFVTGEHVYDPSVDLMKRWVAHVFTFEWGTGGWQLAYDAVQHPTYVADPAEAVDSVGSHTLSRGPRAAARFGLAAPVSAGFYNASGAAFHAYQFAYSADPNYRNWLPNEDCSNFVSQALAAGGWQYRQDGAWDWFYAPAGQSLSWVNAYSLKQFLNFGGRASFLAYFEDLQVGDVLTADWGFNGPGVDHQMIVDARDGAFLSGIYVTYHSVNTYHRPLSDLLASWPTSSNTYWAWHITGTY